MKDERKKKRLMKIDKSKFSYGRRMRLWRKYALISIYGNGRCDCCKEDNIEFLSIDHIGNSRKELRHRRKGKGGVGYKTLAKLGFPHRDKLRVLCYNCNCAHGFYGYCPHNITMKDQISRILIYGNRKGQYENSSYRDVKNPIKSATTKKLQYVYKRLLSCPNKCKTLRRLEGVRI